MISNKYNRYLKVLPLVIFTSWFVFTTKQTKQTGAQTLPNDTYGDWVLTVKQIPQNGKICLGSTGSYIVSITNNWIYPVPFWDTMILGIPVGQVTAQAKDNFGHIFVAEVPGYNYMNVVWNYYDNYVVQPYETKILNIKFTPNRVGKYGVGIESWAWGENVRDDNISNNYYFYNLEVIDCKK